MRRLIILLVLLIISVELSAQDSIVVLHPVIGELIDKEEKVNYLLFPEIEKNTFNYGSVIYLDTNYYFMFNHHDDSISLMRLDSAEIIIYRNNINKLFQYYSNESKDSLEDNNIKSKVLRPEKNTNAEVKSINMDYYRDDILKEIRINERLRYDAEQRRRIDEGSEQYQPNIFLFDSLALKSL